MCTHTHTFKDICISNKKHICIKRQERKEGHGRARASVGVGNRDVDGGGQPAHWHPHAILRHVYHHLVSSVGLREALLFSVKLTLVSNFH